MVNISNLADYYLRDNCNYTIEGLLITTNDLENIAEAIEKKCGQQKRFLKFDDLETLKTSFYEHILNVSIDEIVKHKSSLNEDVYEITPWDFALHRNKELSCILGPSHNLLTITVTNAKNETYNHKMSFDLLAGILLSGSSSVCKFNLYDYPIEFADLSNNLMNDNIYTDDRSAYIVVKDKVNYYVNNAGEFIQGLKTGALWMKDPSAGNYDRIYKQIYNPDTSDYDLIEVIFN